MGVRAVVVRVILYKRTVICRIGSLEIVSGCIRLVILVICRIGSLEKLYIDLLEIASVICRIGSLESSYQGLKIQE